MHFLQTIIQVINHITSPAVLQINASYCVVLDYEYVTDNPKMHQIFYLMLLFYTSRLSYCLVNVIA